MTVKLTALDLKVLDVAEGRTIDGIAYMIGRHKQTTTLRVNRSVFKLLKAGLLTIVEDTYPVEFITTGAGLNALGDSLR